MLEIKNNVIYLTKGDTGVINIEVTGSDVSDKELRFTVRNAGNLDNIMFTLVSGEEPTEAGQISHEAGTNKWTVQIYRAATTELKRKRYFYDFAIEDENSGDKITFVGGGVNKTEFWVT